MTNYIIVDDEHMAHNIIKQYCDMLPNYELGKNCYDALEALDYLKANEVDLIFLDINMPKLSGFDFLKTLVIQPNIIVTTAYSEFALEGYELNIVDYLLKPFSFERFLKAINKIESTPTTNKPIGKFANDERATSIFVKSNKKYIQLQLDRILFVEAVGNYCKIVTKDTEIQIREKISDFIKQLPANEFFQVHKSFIISIIHIASIEGNRIHIDDYVIPVGKVFKSNLNKLTR